MCAGIRTRVCRMLRRAWRTDHMGFCTLYVWQTCTCISMKGDVVNLNGRECLFRSRCKDENTVNILWYCRSFLLATGKCGNSTYGIGDFVQARIQDSGQRAQAKSGSLPLGLLTLNGHQLERSNKSPPVVLVVVITVVTYVEFLRVLGSQAGVSAWQHTLVGQ